ncbi:MAG: bifunctional 5,10-methylenetetrahydrofolate dehydrogenase/5,10-methenyltetrahydrofolate cyclohydrolase [Elusimicrobiota bacterium]
MLMGKEIAKDLRATVRKKIKNISSNFRPPGLKVIVAGEDKASKYYADIIEKKGEEDGIEVDVVSFENPTTEKLTRAITEYNEDSRIDGILIQVPLPDKVNKKRVLKSVSPDKDIDGQTPYNQGKLLTGYNGVYPATAKAVLKILRGNGVSLVGKDVTVVGISNVVGMPAAVLLAREEATVTMCHYRSEPLKKYTRNADILVVAAGVPNLIGENDVKKGAIIVDVGTNEVDGKMVGDVDFENVSKKARVSPVVGGVGALTLSYLFKNTYELYKKHIQSK